MLETAKNAAYAAGEILKENFGRVPQEAVRKKKQNDFLSFVDEESEKKIVEIIQAEFPSHAVLAEESGGSGPENEYMWIVDPLDGTTNYLTGIPLFAVSIALQYQNELVLGVIYDPIRDELFSAEKGRGAFLNGSSIQVSGKVSLNESILATGFPFKTKQFLPQYLQVFHDIFERSIGIRRMGSAAVDLAYLAAGRFDGFWEIGLSPWDTAAGTVLIREAGGQISDFWNGSNFVWNNYILASNGRIHEETGEIIRKHFPVYQKVYE